MAEPTSPAANLPPRRVRSFVRRGGRITVAQARALKELWPKYGIKFGSQPIDLDLEFGRQAGRIAEIGFGNGDTLLALAAAQPDDDFIGIEVHEPGVGRVLLQAQERALANLRVICHDAVEVIESQLAPDTLDEVLIFFPDPWPKKRHHKRRLIQPEFVTRLIRVLKPRGILRLATDWRPYAEHMLEVLNGSASLTNCAADGGFAPRPANRPLTRFEKRGQKLGHGVWDLEFRKG